MDTVSTVLLAVIAVLLFRMNSRLASIEQAQKKPAPEPLSPYDPAMQMLGDCAQQLSVLNDQVEDIRKRVAGQLPTEKEYEEMRNRP